MGFGDFLKGMVMWATVATTIAIAPNEGIKKMIL